MKISSASKKVLASALSAAMVVAFAPTVAFGTPGDIKVNIDLDGGVGTVPAYTQAEKGQTIDLSSIAPTKNGYGLAGWIYDANLDGKIESSETFSGTLPNDGRSEVTIKAVYNLPEASVTAVDNASTAITTAKGPNAETPTHTIQVSLAQTYFKDGANYTVKVTNPDGTELFAKELKAPKADQKAPALAATTIYFVEQPLTVTGSDTSVQVRDDLLVGGDYKIEVFEGTALVSSSKESLAVATFKDSVSDTTKTTTTYDKKWMSGTPATATVTTPSTVGLSWLDANGYNAGDASTNVTVTGNETFTATNIAQTVTKGSYTGSGTSETRTMSFPVKDTATDSGWTASYKATVTAPGGTAIFSKTLASAAVKGAGATLQFTFDQDSTTGTERVAAGIAEVAGTYVCTVEKTLKKDGEADKVSTSKSYVKLTEIKVDAGAGTFSTTNKLTAAQKDYFVANTAGALATVTTPNSNTVEAPEGKTFDTWTCGNAKAGSAAAITVTEGAVNTITAVYKEAAASTQAKAPTVASAVKNADGTYNFKLASEAGTKIAYGTSLSSGSIAGGDAVIATPNTYDAVKGIEKFNSANLYIQADVISGATKLTTPSKVVEVSWDQTAFKSVVAGATSYLEKYVGNSKVKYLEQDGIKAAITAGQAALDAQVADVAADWDKLVTKQLKGVYDAVAAYAGTAIAAYENGAYVPVGDKVYEMTAKQVADAQADLKKVTDKVAKDEADKTAVNYGNQIQTIVTNLNTVLTRATEVKGLAASDIAAAQTVTAALKAATTGEAAEAALAQYAALTDAQKKLVATADVTAAQKVADEAKAQAELKDAQDDAAVSKARNASKTVKAGKNGKTTKKQSVTLKKITSASGAKVTYKKTSGKKAITVKSGKAYLAKGVKKGTYTATVKATCGTQTAKIKVTFKVK